MTQLLKAGWSRLSASARVTTLILLFLAGICASVFFAGHASSQSNDPPSDTIPAGYAAFFGLDLNDPNVASEDPDGDGLSNLEESRLGTDPFSADTDHDGWNDADDNCPVSRMYVPFGNPKFTTDSNVVYAWPTWATAAYTVGGSFSTNDVQCWCATQADTNPAELHIEVDREAISDNAILQLTYFVTSNSSVHIDLYNANAEVVAEDIAGNLECDGQQPTTLHLDIPFADYPDAMGIRIRRDSGEVAVYDSLLYVDLNYDGLDSDQEQQLADSIPVDGGGMGRMRLGGMQTYMMNNQSTSFASWQSGMAITFSGYNRSSTLTNFPMLVVLNNNISQFGYDQFASPIGGDLRFSASDGTTELNYEIESWNTNGSSYIWVQVPALSSSNDYILAFWGNSAATNPPDYTTNGATWDIGFGGVWHMKETVGNNGTQHDSTTNHNNGTFYASGTSTGGVSGLIGNCDYVYGGSGAGQRLSVGDNASIRNPTNLTIGIWAKCYDSTWYQESGCPMGKRGAYYIYPSPNGGKNIRFRFLNGWSRDTPTYTVSDITQWHYYAGRYDKTAQKEVLFFDGHPVATNSVNVTIDNGNELTFGSQPNDGPAQYRGWFDEPRVETVVRPDDWIWACYMTVMSNSAFSSYGSVSSTAVAPTISNANGASNIAANSATLNGSLISTGGAPTTVYVFWGYADAGTTKANWAHTNGFGVNPYGALSTNVTGLTGATTYYYRFYATNSAGEAWADSSSSFSTSLDSGTFSYKMRVAFSGYNKSETLTNFPALVTLGPSLSGFNYGNFASASGGDIRFMAADETTELNYEIEKWNTNGSSYVWVQVPSLTSNAYIWAYWGNSNTTNPPAYTTNGATWTANFSAVWHLKESVTNNGILHDSTANHYDLTFLNKGGSSTAGVSAVVGSGVHIYQQGNSGDCLEKASSSALQVTNFTLSALVKNDESSWNAPMVCRSSYALEPSGGGPSSSMRFRATANSFNKSVDFNPGSSAIQSWHYYAGTYCTSPQKQLLYFDGVQKAQATDCPSPDGGNSVFRVGWDTVGGIPSSRTWFDEVRVETGVRSSNWVWSCYMTMVSNSVFGSYGAVTNVAPPASAPTIDNDGGASTVTSSSATLNGNLTSTGNVATTVFVYWGANDGGTDRSGWSNSVTLGVRAAGMASNVVSSLSAGTTYYYRFYATNSAGQGWAPSTTNFNSLGALTTIILSPSAGEYILR
jgi:hypothetical protein